jgi:hypothetical protein
MGFKNTARIWDRAVSGSRSPLARCRLRSRTDDRYATLGQRDGPAGIRTRV